MRRMPRVDRLIVIVVLALLGARAAAAQTTVTGAVIDTVGRGIAEVSVMIVDRGGVERESARTDSGGRFTIRTTVAGQVRFRARRIGYEPGQTPFMPLDEANRTVIQLVPLARTLATVVVSGSATRQGFESRRARAAGRRIGRYLDSTEIAAVGAYSASDLVDRVRFAAFGVRCVVIDGWFVGRSPYQIDRTRSSLYDQASLGDLRGVEIYDDPRMIPTDLQQKMSWPRGEAPCARVVFLWTKDAFRR